MDSLSTMEGDIGHEFCGMLSVMNHNPMLHHA